ncbi:MAG: hypothetical protein KF884_08035 [Fimbriimonadaceae bacterium]|nr:hypothetical protein [Fimbriimonadaceae bacterium]QYK57499.1 MAG: hypothetical protein KF884_08035 [Fimbriimonadaceae bacterium]
MPRATKNPAEPGVKKPRKPKPQPGEAAGELAMLREQMAQLANQVAALTDAVASPAREEPVEIVEVTPEEHEALNDLMSEIEEVHESQEPGLDLELVVNPEAVPGDGVPSLTNGPSPTSEETPSSSPIASRLPPVEQLPNSGLDLASFADEMSAAFASPEEVVWPLDDDALEPSDPEPFEAVSEAELIEKWPGLMSEISEFNSLGATLGPSETEQAVAESDEPAAPVAFEVKEDDRRTMSNDEIQELLAGMEAQPPRAVEPQPNAESSDIITAAEIEAMLGLGGGLDVGVKSVDHSPPQEPETPAPDEAEPVEDADESGHELELVVNEAGGQSHEIEPGGTALEAVPAHLAASLLVLPVKLDGRTLHVQTPEPVNEEDIHRLRLETGLYVEVTIAPIEQVVAEIRAAYRDHDDQELAVSRPKIGVWKRFLPGGAR